MTRRRPSADNHARAEPAAAIVQWFFDREENVSFAEDLVGRLRARLIGERVFGRFLSDGTFRGEIAAKLLLELVGVVTSLLIEVLDEEYGLAGETAIVDLLASSVADAIADGLVQRVVDRLKERGALLS